MPCLQPVSTRTGVRLAFVALAWALTGAAGAAGAAPSEAAVVHIEATRQAGRVQLAVLATVKAPYAVIWAVLTDYSNMPQWVPDMERSVVLQRMPGGAVVEQSGHAHVLFFRLSVNSVVQVQEHPPERIDVKLVRGDFKLLEGAYELRRLGEADDRYEVRWRGQMELRSPVPGFVAQPLLAGNVRTSFEGLVREMERRAALVAQ